MLSGSQELEHAQLPGKRLIERVGQWSGQVGLQRDGCVADLDIRFAKSGMEFQHSGALARGNVRQRILHTEKHCPWRSAMSVQGRVAMAQRNQRRTQAGLGLRMLNPRTWNWSAIS